MSGRLNNRNHRCRSCGSSLKKTSKAHFYVPLLTFERTQSINAPSRRPGPPNPDDRGHGPVQPKQNGYRQLPAAAGYSTTAA